MADREVIEGDGFAITPAVVPECSEAQRKLYRIRRAAKRWAGKCECDCPACRAFAEVVIDYDAELPPDVPSLRQPQDESSGVAAIYGALPDAAGPEDFSGTDDESHLCSTAAVPKDSKP